MVIWFLRLLRLAAICLLIPAVHQSTVVAQGTERDRQIDEQFLQVLLENPRPGTALDRVFDYHTQTRSLDELLRSLDDDRSGAKQLTRGLIQLKHGDASAAIHSLRTAESLLTDSANASHQLGRALIAEGEDEQAVQAFRRAIDRQPDRRDAPEIFQSLAQLYCRTHQRDQAISVWGQLLERFPDDPSMTERVAAALVIQQDYGLALQHYQRLAQQATSAENRIRYQIRVAELTDRLGDTPKARQQLETILARLRPGSWLHSDVRDRLERTYLSDGDFDGLAEYYRRQADRSPDDLTLLVRRAEILAGAGHIDDAQTSLLQAIAKAPDQFEPRWTLVGILQSEGSSAEAARHLEHLLSIDPTHPDVGLRLGDVYLADPMMERDRRRDAARDAWNRLAQANPDDAVLLANLAQRMKSIDDNDRAVQLYRQAIQASPDDPQLRESLGELLHQLGRHDEAIVIWRSIADGPRPSAASLIHVAGIFESIRRFDLALQTWNEAGELDLSFDQRLRYAGVLWGAEQFDAAAAELDAASERAESAEESERLMRRRIEFFQVADRLGEQIAEVSRQTPTAENRRYLALLCLADGHREAASRAIDAAIELEPENVAVLRDAVDIAERLGRDENAARHLKRLTRLDKRRSVDHFRRLVGIRKQLGQIELALKVADDMVAANPASAAAHHLYAQIAFVSGKHPQGEAALRRAVSLDPRNNEARVDLAIRLADRSETAEAIALLWKSVEQETELESQIERIEQLVQLYEQRGEVEQLVTRIKRLERDDVDSKSKSILVATVWSSVEDFKQAQFVLQRGLGKHPHDVSLLQAMVQLLSRSGDLVSAVTQQRRLVQVQDTPAARARLTSLEFQAGLITQAEVTMREMKATRDPKRMASIIRRGAGSDPEQAAELCRVALEIDPDLWDIKIVRAQLLLLSDSPDRAQHVALAGRVAGEVAALELDHDLKATSGIAPVASSTSVFYSTRQAALAAPARGTTRYRNLLHIERPSSMSTPGLPIGRPAQTVVDRDHFPASTAGTLQTILMLNERRITSRINNGAKSYSFGFGSNFVAPQDYFQAFWIARCVQILADRELAILDGRQISTKQITQKRFPPPSIDSDDVAAFRHAITLHAIRDSMDGTETLPAEQILWRVAQLDPAGDQSSLAEWLAKRSRIRQDQETEARAKIQPLDEVQLEILADVCRARRGHVPAGASKGNASQEDTELRRNLVAEYRFAGKTPPEFVLADPGADSSGKLGE
ncbi:tetratricopeptide repeat protein [Rhodopirellula sp. JC639]|uniref:tetratricopeptide repeat protein n=1 Tax=Stieleria mannarensis TaxID=2755585 RepID=UPI0015FEE3E2|nr:tetratricopeptide repeat protein [Rhodopirellula sp. JC639]